MTRVVVVFLLLVGLTGTVLAQDLGPDAQKIMTMIKGGVDDSVIVAYVQAQGPSLVITRADLNKMKEAGASPDVVSALEAARTRKAARFVTESQLFRLYGGMVIHNNRTYDVSGGMPTSLRQELDSNARARPLIDDYSKGMGIAQTMTWTGLGLLVGGALYAGITQAAVPSNASVNNSIGLTAVAVGVGSLVFQSFFRAAAYQSLYTGLYQYNSDLVNGVSGGNP